MPDTRQEPFPIYRGRLEVEAMEAGHIELRLPLGPKLGNASFTVNLDPLSAATLGRRLETAARDMGWKLEAYR